MIKQLLAGALLALILFPACQSNPGTPAPAATAPLQFETRNFVKHYCVNDDQCADFNVFFLQFAENSPQIVRQVSDLIRARIIAGLEGNTTVPFEAALDSMGTRFIDDFVQLKRENPDNTMGQDIQVTSNVLANTGKLLTVRIDFNTYTGGAHPNSTSTLMSFDLTQNARELAVADMLPDSTAVLPLLEQAYKAAKGLQAGDDIKQLLLGDIEKLPLPANIGIVPEGLLFVYNNYEIAPYAVGGADILLTWEQLGQSADRKRWLE